MHHPPGLGEKPLLTSWLEIGQAPKTSCCRTDLFSPAVGESPFGLDSPTRGGITTTKAARTYESSPACPPAFPFGLAALPLHAMRMHAATEGGGEKEPRPGSCKLLRGKIAYCSNLIRILPSPCCTKTEEKEGQNETSGIRL